MPKIYDGYYLYDSLQFRYIVKQQLICMDKDSLLTVRERENTTLKAKVDNCEAREVISDSIALEKDIQIGLGKDKIGNKDKEINLHLDKIKSQKNVKWGIIGGGALGWIFFIVKSLKTN